MPNSIPRVLASFVCQLDTGWSYHREKSFSWGSASTRSSCGAFSQLVIKWRGLLVGGSTFGLVLLGSTCVLIQYKCSLELHLQHCSATLSFSRSTGCVFRHIHIHRNSQHYMLSILLHFSFQLFSFALMTPQLRM